MAKSVVGVFENENQAKEAINELKRQGFDEREISLIAREEREQGVGQEDEMSMAEQDLGDGMLTGGALGGIAGILAGAGALLVPGVGPIIAAGPLAAFLSGVVGGGLVGGLVDYGIPEERGRYYEERIKQGHILAALKAKDNEVGLVTQILSQYGATDVESH